MKKLLLVLFAATSLCSSAQTPVTGMSSNNEQLPFKQHNLLLQQATYTPAHPGNRAAKTTTGTGPVWDTTQWNHRVDSTWGSGWPDSEKLGVLNRWWGHIDSLYPCFVHLPSYNWDSIVNDMRAKITAGVSEGKFAGMINYLLGLVNDGHANFYDYAVNYPSSIYQGLPVFRGESGKLGACVTTLHDTSALVYYAQPLHPLGLQPGDIILGYNGIPWTQHVATILRYQLPNSVYKGSTDSATYHRYIQAAGENWYLFDTINIKKCDGSIVNLPTSLMAGHLYQDFCTEQMPVSGVHKPTYNEYYSSHMDITYGVLTGTRIGYVYMYDCTDTTHKLYKAFKTLIEDSLITGLILDIRTNFGGGFGTYWDAYQYITSGGTSWVGYAQRATPTNRLTMTTTGPTTWYDIYDGDPAFFNYPIAVICGPNAVSAGDFLPVMFKHNPMVKLFGKSTAGAYGNLVPVNVGHSGFVSSMQQTNFFEASAPSYYLSHTNFPVDYYTWFDRDSVCAGKDNIVTTAVQWIEGTTAVTNRNLQSFSGNVFPNPASQFINISISSPVDDNINIRLCDMTSAVVQELNYRVTQGNNAVKIDLEKIALPSGNYYLQIQGSDGNRTIRKVAVVR